MKKEEWIRILYPRRCPICEEIVLPRGEKICFSCRSKLPYIKEPRCKKCGKQLRIMEQEYCEDCKKRNRSFDAGLALFEYNAVMRESVERFKFKNKREYVDFYAEEVEKHLKKLVYMWKAEVLIPVPVHARKRRKRGFNQAEVLAEAFGKALGLETDKKVLYRCKNTIPQKELNEKERIKNLQDAFQIEKNVVQYNRVILVDDIFTSGSTIESCTRVLKNNGIGRVYALCLCIGKGF
ncbi:MAG: ComF family protein [Lachnospiraceae bacterium]|nr:ComF family protein [Lachnospiraceae bacterium]